MTKRLFLFAGYNGKQEVSDTLLFYIRALSNVGDIVLTMDNDLKSCELQKLNGIKNLLHVQLGHHGEYDFGSYKRCFLWCQDNGILDSYDYIYFVNDSVLGPAYDIKPVLEDLEKSDTDMNGMFYTTKQWVTAPSDIVPPHIQSWFIGIKPKVARAKYFRDFITGVCKQDCKANIIIRYEVGFTELLKKHKCSISYVFTGDVDHDLYRMPELILENNVPFIKKGALNLLTPDDLQKYINPELLQIIKRNHLYKQKKYKTVKRLRLCGIKILTLKQKIGTDKKRWFLFGVFPLI